MLNVSDLASWGCCLWSVVTTAVVDVILLGSSNAAIIGIFALLVTDYKIGQIQVGFLTQHQKHPKVTKSKRLVSVSLKS